MILDDPLADYADDSKPDLRGAGLPSPARGEFDGKFRIVVQACVWASMDGTWINRLRQAAGGKRPMKWADVRAYVAEERSADSTAVRAALGSQGIIVTDPMRLLRETDLASDAAGQMVAPLAFFIVGDGGRSKHPYVASQRATLRRFVIHSMLGSSGVGTICDLLAGVDSYEIDGNIRRRSGVSASVRGGIIRELGASINKSALLATHATTLASPLLDPDHPDRLRSESREPFTVDGQDWRPPALVCAEVLGVVAQRRLVLDRGHDDVAAQAAKLRDLAELSADPLYALERARGIEALQQTALVGEARGYVRTGDDAFEQRLELADICAGWARTLVETRGFLGLVRECRCVIYEGLVLTADAADRLDEDRRRHRALITSFARRMGWN